MGKLTTPLSCAERGTSTSSVRRAFVVACGSCSSSRRTSSRKAASTAENKPACQGILSFNSRMRSRSREFPWSLNMDIISAKSVTLSQRYGQPYELHKEHNQYPCDYHPSQAGPWANRDTSIPRIVRSNSTWVIRRLHHLGPRIFRPGGHCIYTHRHQAASSSER